MTEVLKGLTLLQANLHRCRLAQDLLTQFVTEKEIDVAIISEPYRIVDTWYADTKEDAAIWVTPDISRRVGDIKRITKEGGIVAITLDDLNIFSVYISPNVPHSEFQDALGVLEREVTRVGAALTIIAGDFNAKSTRWGSKCNDNREYDIIEMAARLNLKPIRSKGEYTFDRDGRRSPIDILLCGKNCASALSTSVILDVLTASDHRYVRHIFKRKDNVEYKKDSSTTQHRTKIDMDQFNDLLQEWAWSCD
ncbi:uncharacterized protein LOC144477600, partial [Augochlora pura]